MNTCVRRRECRTEAKKRVERGLVFVEVEVRGREKAHFAGASIEDVLVDARTMFGKEVLGLRLIDEEALRQLGVGLIDEAIEWIERGVKSYKLLPPGRNSREERAPVHPSKLPGDWHPAFVSDSSRMTPSPQTWDERMQELAEDREMAFTTDWHG